ncbi:protein TolQ [Hellea sp.]|nr:protein TolQ [Hellea sp.]MDC0651143.1 protein TolQ [Hellea sp.]MDC1062158.1 protein TolQ [Hellea sp.]MDC1089722.1 protein TolQ [Hellea sp.]
MQLFELFLQSNSLDAIVTSDFSFSSLFLRADWVVRGVMLILMAASIWSWAIAVDKGIMIFSLNKHAKTFEDIFWSGKTLDELKVELKDSLRDPMSRVFSAAIKEYDEYSSLKIKSNASMSSQYRIDSIMNLIVNRELSKLERGMTTLATIGSSSVFIGLFGTVWGIMNSFRAIAASQNTSLTVVAPGIAEALFATALGLMAAIPAVIFYNKYTADLNKYGGRLEGYADELSAILSRKISKNT